MTTDTQAPQQPAAIVSPQQWLDALSEKGTWRDRKRLREQFRANPAILAEVDRLNNKWVDWAVDRLFYHPYDSFEPRPDDVLAGDEQAGFFECDKLISVALGGNGSGKTYTAAQKCVEFVRKTPPPVVDTPFWVIGNTYELSCGSCWFQKLKNIIPREWVDWDRITWKSVNRQWPFSVPLFPWEPGGGNWILEFKSYEQGRELMQAAAIGGAWFTEQFPYEIFEEVLRGAREYGFPGSIFCEQTPVDPEKSVQLQTIFEGWSAGDQKYKNWAFFHINTEVAMKAGHVDEAWYETYFGSISEEMLETRKLGMFASFEGAIYQSFKPKIHLVDSADLGEPPQGVFHYRSIDWGASEEHPFVCLWGFKDTLGNWVIYDEYWSNSQTILWQEHADEILSRVDWQNHGYHRQSYADPSRPDLFREFAAYGIHLSAANNAVYEGIESVRRALRLHKVTNQPGLIIVRDKCPKLARQMSTYRWEHSSGAGTNPKAAKPVPLKRDDDSVDALRYLVHSERGSRMSKSQALKIASEMSRSVRLDRKQDR